MFTLFALLPWKSTILPYSALFVTISFVLYLVSKHIRYDFGREFVLNLFCSMQGRKSLWVSDPALARRLLSSSSSKGSGIEQILSTKAFLPIISLESVNGDQWERMKENFLTLKTHLPPLDELAKIAGTTAESYLEKEEIIDSRALSKLIVEIMQTWLFGDSGEVSDEVIAAIEEWRKEIAIKGRGGDEVKALAVSWIQGKIRRNRKYFEIFGEKWFTDAEYWSDWQWLSAHALRSASQRLTRLNYK
ncbi:uncharacterized protein LOC118433623 [Folsomia candida]|uniref:Uncharacterized protein n=1 Tax=Folsomia candida TaxID=158441 RepID=A0A226CX89_FOLCA|nr:uncharacterized protein LOC118433623 [Folsomia candida]XP_035701654.1 uncharacterized protein LOC118433623 [Folsomia candida]OXA37127.1 hypothetical protein Fcan01_28094 [Folsomia candida]